MRLFYFVLLYSVLNMPIYAVENNDKKQECSIKINLDNIKNNLGKVLLCVIATIAKHPFMTCWSLYATFCPEQIISENSEGKRMVTSQSRSSITWIVDAWLLGDFAHNILHAYNVKHYPCEKEISHSTNPEKTSDTEIQSNSTE